MSPSERILWSSENANGQSLEKSSIWEALLKFFFPTSKFFDFFPPNVLVLERVVKCLGGSVVYWHWGETDLSFNPDSALCLRQCNISEPQCLHC